MQKEKIKNFLDFIPLFILSITAIILIWTVSASNLRLFWKHNLGLVMLAVNYILFFWRHKVGVLFLGLTLLFGLVSLLSYNPTVATTTVYTKIGDKEVPFFYGQLTFLLWIVVHFIVSSRHYVGIATKKYWQGLMDGSTVRFD